MPRLFRCFVATGWLLGAICLASLPANAVPGSSPSTPDLRKIDPALALIKRFENSALWASEWPHAPGFSPIDGVVKFPGAVYFDFLSDRRDVYEDPWTTEFLKKTMPEISRITGLSFLDLAVPQGAEMAIFVRVTSNKALREDMVNFGMDPRAADNASGPAICNHWLALDYDGRLKFTYVFVKSEFPPEFRRHCILKNVMAALGMGVADRTPRTDPAEISRRPFPALTLDDKILLRTLYDPRITTEMTGTTVTDTARRIIPELRNAAFERGQTALYQR